MATFNTPLYTAQVGGAGASLNVNLPGIKNAEAKVKVVPILYTLLATEAANDLINLTKLKLGARVIAGLSRIICQDPGTTLTVRIGDTNDAARYAGTIDISAGGDFPLSTTPGTDLYVPTDIAVPIPPNTATDQTVVILKVITAAALTAGNKLLILLAVVEE